MKFIVFGLGNYGAALSAKLVSLGHEVIGVDLRMELVERFKNTITHTICMDAGSPDAVRSLPLRDVDVVINTIGENEGSNIMLTALLQQIGVKRLICRVIPPLQKTVLETMDVKEFVYPEADSAERLAYRLDLKGVVDSFKITDRYQLIEVNIPDRYVDRKMQEIDFMKYPVQPVTLLRHKDEKSIIGTLHKVKQVVGVLTPETVLKKDDILVLFGEVDKLEGFIEQS
jgi:trk system potassium uptake protein TrkA